MADEAPDLGQMSQPQLLDRLYSNPTVGKPEWNHDDVEPASTEGQARVSDFLATHARAGRTWKETREHLQDRFPEVVPYKVQPAFEEIGHGLKLQQARDKYAGMEETTGSWLKRRAIPLASTVLNVAAAKEYGNARQRLEKDKAPRPEDYDTIANFEKVREEDVKGSETWGGTLASAGAHLPGMVGEFALGGVFMQGLGLAGQTAAQAAAQTAKVSVPLLSTQGALQLAKAAPGAIGRNMAQTALVPSMYAEKWVHNNIEAGRDPLAVKGFPAAFASGMIQNAILGQVGNYVAGKIPGETLAGFAGRTAAKAGLGTAEQAGADILTYAAGMDAHYGLLEDVVKGQYGDALKHATVTALTFGALGAMHEKMHGSPQMQQEALKPYLATLKQLQERGFSPDAAGKALGAVGDRLADFLRENPNPSRAEVAEHFKDLKGPQKQWASILTNVLPEFPETGGEEKGLPGRTAATQADSDQAMAMRSPSEQAKAKATPTAESPEVLAQRDALLRGTSGQANDLLQKSAEMAGLPPQPFHVRFPVGSQVEYTQPGTISRKGSGEIVGHKTDPVTGDTFARVKTASGEEMAGDANDIRHQPAKPPAAAAEPKTARQQATGLEEAHKNGLRELQEAKKAEGQEVANAGMGLKNNLKNAQRRRRQAEKDLKEVESKWTKARDQAALEELASKPKPEPLPEVPQREAPLGKAIESPQAEGHDVTKQAEATPEYKEAVARAEQPGTHPEEKPAERPPGPQGVDAGAAEGKEPRPTWFHTGTKFRENPDGYTEFTAKNGAVYRIGGEFTGNGHKNNLQVEVYDQKGNKVGDVLFDRREEGSGNNYRTPKVLVQEAHRGRGLAEAMYDFATEDLRSLKEMGDPRAGELEPTSQGQAEGGKGLWQKNAERRAEAAKKEGRLARMRQKSQAPVASPGSSESVLKEHGEKPVEQEPVEEQPSAKAERETEILQLRRSGLSQPAVGKKLGLTAARIGQIEREAMEKEAAGLRSVAEESLSRHKQEYDQLKEHEKGYNAIESKLTKILAQMEQEIKDAGGELPAERVESYAKLIESHEKAADRNRWAPKSPAAKNGPASASAGKEAAKSSAATKPAAEDQGEGLPGATGAAPDSAAQLTPERAAKEKEFQEIKAELQRADAALNASARSKDQKARDQAYKDYEAIKQKAVAFYEELGNPKETEARASAVANGAMDDGGFIDTQAIGKFVAGIKDRVVSAVKHVGFELAELRGKMFPRTAAKSEEAANDITHFVAANGFIRLETPDMIDRVMGKDATPEKRLLHGTALSEERHRTARYNYTEQSRLASNAAADARGAAERELDPVKHAAHLEEAAKQSRRATEYMHLAQGVKTFVGDPDYPLPDEATLRKVWDSPDYQQTRKGWEEHMRLFMERNYRESQGLADGEPIDSLSQIPEVPINARVGMPGSRGQPVAGGRGNLKNPKQVEYQFAKEAKLNADKYDTDLGSMIENSMGAYAGAMKAAMYRGLVDSGLAKWGKRGAGYSDESGVTFKELPGVNPPKGTQAAEPGETSLYVHPDSYHDVRRALEVDKPLEPGTVKAFNQALTTAALASTVEMVSHGKNLLTFLFKPGVNPLDVITEGRKILSKDPDTMKRLSELARIGALKTSGLESMEGQEPTSKLDPRTWLKYGGEVLDFLQQTMRLVGENAYDRLVKTGRVEASETGKRDFINQLGQYNRAGQQKYVALLRDTGWGPFATAGTNYYMQGLSSLYGDPGLKGSSTAHRIGLHAEVLGRIALVAGTAAFINYLAHGRVDGSDDTPLGAIKLGDSNGKTIYYDLTNLTGLTRGMRATGLLALSEGMRRGDTGGQIFDKGFRHAWQSALHPAEGPAVAAIHTAFTGENSIGTKLSKKAMPGQSQSLNDLTAALMNANPIIGAGFGFDNPKGEHTELSRLWKGLGPFGPHERGKGEKQEPTDDALEEKIERRRLGTALLQRRLER